MVLAVREEARTAWTLALALVALVALVALALVLVVLVRVQVLELELELEVAPSRIPTTRCPMSTWTLTQSLVCPWRL